MRLAFMGSPAFSVPCLDALIEAGHEVVAVYCQPPRPAGRGKAEQKGPVHLRALELGILVRTPKSLKSADEQKAFADLNLDAGVVAAYGLILPEPILAAPRLGCLNVHASLLPRWRGAAPIQRAVMAGDRESGITIMQMDAGLDTGDMLLQQRVAITDTMTAGELHDALAALGGPMMVQVLSDLAAGRARPVPQPEKGVTYANKIDKAEARIDWTKKARVVDCHIRGLSPFPGAWCEAEKDGTRVRIKVIRTRYVNGRGAPGEILGDALTVACGDGAVQLLELQREGKKPQSTGEFVRGFTLPEGAILL